MSSCERFKSYRDEVDPGRTGPDSPDRECMLDCAQGIRRFTVYEETGQTEVKEWRQSENEMASTV